VAALRRDAIWGEIGDLLQGSDAIRDNLSLPKRLLCNVLTLRRIRWIAMRLSNSSLYAFATNSASENVPMMTGSYPSWSSFLLYCYISKLY
jgi:hypothetical protein